MQVNEVKQTVSELTESVVSLRKIISVLLVVMVFLQLIIAYQVMNSNSAYSTGDDSSAETTNNEKVFIQDTTKDLPKVKSDLW